MAKAVIQNDIPRAQRTAHTLKGVAGGIGAQALYDSAQKVETALKENQLNQLDPLMKNLARDLAHVVEDLEKKIMTPSLDIAGKITSTPVDIKKLSALLDDFQRLAEEMDPDMDSKAEEIHRLLHLYDSPLKQISVTLLDYAENLDFEDALGTMKKLRNELDGEKNG